MDAPSPARGKVKQHQEAEVYSVHSLITDLKACRMRRDLQRGRRIHAKAVESRNHENMYVVTALINMYAKCGNMVEAGDIFNSVQKNDVVSWTAMLLGYVDNGRGLIALEMFSRMKLCGCVPDSVTYIAALKACIVIRSGSGREDCLERGREIHLEIGCHLTHNVQNTLIDMYARSGSMTDAHRVFYSVHKPDVVSWNALVLGYAENGNGIVALEMFSRMKTLGCKPDSVTYVAAIKACTSLAGTGNEDCLTRARGIHSEASCYLDFYVLSALIDMYAKFGCMIEARHVFDSIRRPDVVTWNALLQGYAENGEGEVALEMFSRMKLCKCSPSSVTYIAVLKACTSLAESGDESCLEWGRKIHSQIGRHLNRYVLNTLIDMYAKCGRMLDARLLFDSVQKPDVVSWTAIIMGYADNGDGHTALEMFSRMKTCECTPNSLTYIAALKACGFVGALALGRKIHQEISEVDAKLLTCLVDFYAKCGSMEEAQVVFNFHSKTRDTSTWTALLAGYGSFGDTDSVFKLFEAMCDEGFLPNAVTFVCMLLCCNHAGLLEKARGCFETMSVKYKIIPTVMHYTCMVDVLGRENQLNQAISMIQKMPFKHDGVIWKTLLGACCKWKNVKMGKLAFQSLVDIDKSDASAYVIMGQIYGSLGMWEDHERVLEMKAQVGAWKQEQAYVLDGIGKMVMFVNVK